MPIQFALERLGFEGVLSKNWNEIQKADKIVVMQNGQIAEQGSHEQLLALNGTYTRLVNMQSFE